MRWHIAIPPITTAVAAILSVLGCEQAGQADGQVKYEDELVELSVLPQRRMPGETKTDTLYLLAVKPDRYRGIDLQMLHYVTTAEGDGITGVSLVVERDGEVRETIAEPGRAGHVSIMTSDGHWMLFDLDDDGGMDIIVNPNLAENNGCACLCYIEGDWIRGTQIRGDGAPAAEINGHRYTFEDGVWTRRPGSDQNVTGNK